MSTFHSKLWLLFNLILGAVAGVALGWGPLAAPMPAIVALGLAGALLGVAIGRRSC